MDSIATFNAVASAFGGDDSGQFQRYIASLMGEDTGARGAKKIEQIEAMEFAVPDFAVAEG